MTAPAASATATQQSGLYVYCVAGGEGARLLGPIGLDGQVVYTVSRGGLRAVVHNCPAQPYQSQDPQVVEAWVVAHQNVVRAATEAFGTVLPMAFDMVVRGGPGGEAAAALQSWLEEKRERFERLLARLAGQAEYGVQVFWDREAIAASLVQTDDVLRAIQEEARSKPKGLAHLLRQKLAKAVGEALEKQADRFAQDFYARIRTCVEDVHVDELKKAGGGAQMLLNLSCLMREGARELGSVLDQIRAVPGISVRFTGPWPPYSFVGA